MYFLEQTWKVRRAECVVSTCLNRSISSSTLLWHSLLSLPLLRHGSTHGSCATTGLGIVHMAHLKEKRSQCFFLPLRRAITLLLHPIRSFPAKTHLDDADAFFLHNKTKPTHAHPMMIILVSRIYKGGKRGLWTLIRVRSPSKNAGIFYCHSSNRASLRNYGVVVFQGLSNDSSSFLTVLLGTL